MQNFFCFQRRISGGKEGESFCLHKCLTAYNEHHSCWNSFIQLKFHWNHGGIGVSCCPFEVGVPTLSDHSENAASFRELSIGSIGDRVGDELYNKRVESGAAHSLASRETF